MASRTSRHVQLGLAALFGLALILLTGTIGTAARWTNSQQLSPAILAAGKLNLTAKSAPQVLWQRYGTDGTRTISTYDGVSPLKPGESLLVKQRVALTIKGSNLKAVLIADPASVARSSSSDLLTEVSSGLKTSVQPDPSFPTLLPVAGKNSQWQVGPEHNGAIYTVTLEIPIRKSTNGLDGGNAPAGNWWNQRIQGGSINLGSLALRLEQTS